MSQDQAVAAPSRTSTFRNELNDAVGLTPYSMDILIIQQRGGYENDAWVIPPENASDGL
jgi:hypothetical protein